MQKSNTKQKRSRKSEQVLRFLLIDTFPPERDASSQKTYQKQKKIIEQIHPEIDTKLQK